VGFRTSPCELSPTAAAALDTSSAIARHHRIVIVASLQPAPNAWPKPVRCGCCHAAKQPYSYLALALLIPAKAGILPVKQKNQNRAGAERAVPSRRIKGG
jgi:hypothetical protein